MIWSQALRLKTRMKVVAAELRGGRTVRRTAQMIWSQARMIRMNDRTIRLHPPNFCDGRGDIIRTIRDKVRMIRLQSVSNDAPWMHYPDDPDPAPDDPGPSSDDPAMETTYKESEEKKVGFG